jgi:hypothetical protein
MYINDLKNPSGARPLIENPDATVNNQTDALVLEVRILRQYDPLIVHYNEQSIQVIAVVRAITAAYCRGEIQIHSPQRASS